MLADLCPKIAERSKKKNVKKRNINGRVDLIVVLRKVRSPDHK